MTSIEDIKINPVIDSYPPHISILQSNLVFKGMFYFADIGSTLSMVCLTKMTAKACGRNILMESNGLEGIINFPDNQLKAECYQIISN